MAEKLKIYAYFQKVDEHGRSRLTSWFVVKEGELLILQPDTEPNGLKLIGPRSSRKRRLTRDLRCFRMKRRKPTTCKKSYCTEAVVIDGFCHEHHEEQREERLRRDEAVRVLHHGIIDDRGFEKPELQDEFAKLQKWWNRACNAENFHREDPVLKDEASPALSWCIALAMVLIREERAHRSGDAGRPPYDHTREWVWDRFKNLEAGLMSNGVARPNR